MKIEVLFPEICNLYGDLANIRYLRECIPDAEVIRTSLQQKPRFTGEEVDLVYMGTTTEQGQRLALEQLRFYREAMFERIEAGGHVLVTGNAMELFGARIEEDGEEVCQGLGLFPGVARRSSVNRFNSLFLGTFDPDPAADPARTSAAAGEHRRRDALTANDLEFPGGGGESPDQGSGGAFPEDPDIGPGGRMRIVGYKSQFGHMFGEESEIQLDEMALFTAGRGPGMNREALGEGVRINNFLATYVIGPLLVLNPPFTRWYIRSQLGLPLEKLAYEEAALDSYHTRVQEYADPSTGLYYWGGTTQRWT